MTRWSPSSGAGDAFAEHVARTAIRPWRPRRWSCAGIPATG